MRDLIESEAAYDRKWGVDEGMLTARNDALCTAAKAPALVASLGPQATGAQTASVVPNAARGLRLSRLLRESCRVLEEDPQESAQAGVRSFIEIANPPVRAEETLVNYILVPQPKMPNESVSHPRRTHRPRDLYLHLQGQGMMDREVAARLRLRRCNESLEAFRNSDMWKSERAERRWSKG